MCQYAGSCVGDCPCPTNCDYQSGYRCMINPCYEYQQPCGSTNVYSCKDDSKYCCFGTCSGVSTTILSNECCCETMSGRGCLNRTMCQYAGSCVGDCPCPTNSTITTTVCKDSDATCGSNSECCSGNCHLGICTNTTEKCVPIHQSGDSSNKLDIVFLANNYKNFLEFTSDVDLHTNTLFSIEPFASNSNRINIWRVDENFDLGCYGDWAIACDDTKVAEATSNCPSDQVIVLTEFGGGACSGYIRLNTHLEGADRATVHELGHCFGGLLDEYLHEPSENPNIPKGPNCDDNSCSSWTGILGTDCIKNCSYTNWYRPTEQSVMNNHYDIRNFYFNPPSIMQLQNLLNHYSDQTPAPLPEPAKIYFLKFNYNKGVITLKNISIGEGFAPDRNIQPAVGYEMGLLSKSGEVLQSFVFDPPKQMFYDYFDNGQVKGGVTERDNFDFVEIAPYSTDTSSINVLSQNKEVLSADFSTLAKQSKLYMVTSEGDKRITVTADDAAKTAGITVVKQVDIKEENATPIYSVNGTQEAKLLFIIPVSMDIQAKVNAQNGNIISLAKPWWSILVK